MAFQKKCEEPLNAQITFRCTEKQKELFDTILRKRQEKGKSTDARDMIFQMIATFKKSPLTEFYPL